MGKNAKKVVALQPEPITKAELFLAFVRLRRIARSIVRCDAEWRNDYLLLRRQKRTLQGQNSPFDQARLAGISTEITRISEIRRENHAELVCFGPNLMEMCSLADQMLTFREKAHVLGVSEQHLRNRLCGKGEDTRLYTMIFANHGEYRDKAEFIGPCQIAMPLWEIASAWFHHLLKTDQSFSDKCSEGLDEFLAGVPKYQRLEYADGTTEFKRLPPELRMISGKGGAA